MQCTVSTLSMKHVKIYFHEMSHIETMHSLPDVLCSWWSIQQVKIWSEAFIAKLQQTPKVTLRSKPKQVQEMQRRLTWAKAAAMENAQWRKVKPEQAAMEKALSRPSCSLIWRVSIWPDCLKLSKIGLFSCPYPLPASSQGKFGSAMLFQGKIGSNDEDSGIRIRQQVGQSFRILCLLLF